MKRLGRRRGCRGSRKRGIECSEAMVRVMVWHHDVRLRIGGCGGPMES